MTQPQITKKNIYKEKGKWYTRKAASIQKGNCLKWHDWIVSGK